MKNKLNLQLNEINMSKTNKSLRSYSANGTKQWAICTINAAALSHSDIPDEFALPMALICANRYMNGGGITGMRDIFITMTPAQEVKTLAENPVRLLDTYHKIHNETLLRYKKAIEIIDTYNA